MFEKPDVSGIVKVKELKAGAELDAIIAVTFFDWKVTYTEGYADSNIVNVQRISNDCPSNVSEGKILSFKRFYQANVPAYSSTPALAFEVATKLAAEGISVDIELKRNGKATVITDSAVIVTDDAPLAICKAALMARGLRGKLISVA